MSMDESTAGRRVGQVATKTLTAQLRSAVSELFREDRKRMLVSHLAASHVGVRLV